MQRSLVGSEMCIRDRDLGEGIVVVFANKDDKVGLAVGVTDNLTSKFDAVQFVKVGSEIIGGKGGGLSLIHI